LASNRTHLARPQQELYGVSCPRATRCWDDPPASRCRSSNNMENEMICSICSREIKSDPISNWAGGNNAQPINDGRCCDLCNSLVVIPARVAMIKAIETKESEDKS